MNKHQKLLYKTAKNFWRAIQRNSNYNRDWNYFYRSFKRSRKEESLEDLKRLNEWAKEQYEKSRKPVV